MNIYSARLAVRSRCHRAFFGLLWWLCLTPFAYAADDLRVLLVLSDSNPPYQTFAKTFKQSLSANIQAIVLERAEDFSGDGQQTDLIVTVGVKAADWVAARTTIPMLAAMIPSNKYAELLAKRPSAKQISAIFLDQPWARQVDLLHAVLPERSKIGVLYSPDTKLDLEALRGALADHGYTLIAKPLRSHETLFADLEDVLVDSDVLFAVPDGAIYSSSNIRNILLSSYRRGVPLIGLSQAYVNAGAVCAVFSTPEQLAAQASAATISFAQTRQLRDAQFPVLYTIAVNQEVARTLGITINSAELLHLQVEKAQGRSP